MPKSKKPTRKRGKTPVVQKPTEAFKPRFDQGQSKLPMALRNVWTGKGGKPKLFPGRTGGR